MLLIDFIICTAIIALEIVRTLLFLISFNELVDILMYNVCSFIKVELKVKVLAIF